MAVVSEALARLQAETKCPVCLDDLTDPVTIECGHNFCRRCIRQTWADFTEKFPCPVCRFECEECYYRSNTQLGRMVQIARRLHSSCGKRRRSEKTTLCEKHGQELMLFCEEELEVLCPQCVSPEHSNHRVSPLVDAAQRHRAKLRNYAKGLRKQADDTQKLISAQSRAPLELHEKAEARRQKLASEVQLLGQFLEREQQAAFERLAEEERHIQQQLEDNIRAFTNYRATMQSLLARVEGHSSLSEVELLAQIKHFYPRSDCEISPPIFSINLPREACNFPPQYSELQKIRREFRVDIILDPEMSYPNLLISPDRKCVKFTKKRPRSPRVSKRSSAVVLGFPDFYSGRHFWQVEVGDVPQWAVGVCRAAQSSKGRRAGQGCWRLQLLQQGGYEAPGARPAKLQLEVRDRTLGIFLDYELGEVTFYDMPDGAHICTFSDSFSGPLRPYFYLGPESKSLRILRERFGE
ncbi:putative tripartite motif-containing protein 75 [Octodon degus]|uniref:Tripartite motif-containing protein 75 n=1 Tax=Octodon degus TaxID=10160 RepID=A0A6P3F712_OCTDE|nr:putative tripartite motif-containing protein 75 [Octodon degus]